MADIILPRSTKKMLIFVSSENNIWKKTLTDAPTQKQIADKLKLAASTISSWKGGAPISDKLAEKIFSTTRDVIRNTCEPEDQAECEAILVKFEQSYGDDQEDVYTLAENIGLPMDVAQKILDQVIYKRYSIFPGMHYSNLSEAKRSFRKYGGLYDLWVQRSAIWYKCQLRVRYILDFDTHFIIRCKLNFPNKNNRDLPWEYDGFLIEKDFNIFWLFEKRSDNRSDYFTFITPCQQNSVRKVKTPDKFAKSLVGTYLTTDQDASQTIVTGQLFLQQEDAVLNHKQVQDRMHKDLDILDTCAKCKPVNDVWELLKAA